jgi:2-polyprenyl-3-methyl-5-hydroxy-6-metoxy-1,4-benzoquinol methylase
VSRFSCRFCGSALTRVFCDLGVSPLSNRYLRADQLMEMEPFYPLTVFVCSECRLVQLGQFQSPEEIFTDYAYFSSYSESWLAHAARYAEAMIRRFRLNAGSQVIEIASNDGYLLRFFRGAGIPVLGIEPAANVAAIAEEEHGIRTLVQFFGQQLAAELAGRGQRADLLVANNVLAHVPDLNDFVAGLKVLLKQDGVITIEVPHLLRLMLGNQFDTVYHEHFSYFSLLTAQQVFAEHGLAIFDVEELPTHGGSLRIFLRHPEHARTGPTDNVRRVIDLEREHGLDRLDGYRGFDERVQKTKRNLLSFLIDARDRGRQVVGYGAPAKGNTLLNYCGIRTDLLGYTVDRSVHKQGKFLPGTHIPIFAPERLRETRPDYVLLLPWNLREEIARQVDYIRDWSGRFVVPIPQLEVLE